VCGYRLFFMPHWFFVAHNDIFCVCVYRRQTGSERKFDIISIIILFCVCVFTSEAKFNWSHNFSAPFKNILFIFLCTAQIMKLFVIQHVFLPVIQAYFHLDCTKETEIRFDFRVTQFPINQYSTCVWMYLKKIYKKILIMLVLVACFSRTCATLSSQLILFIHLFESYFSLHSHSLDEIYKFQSDWCRGYRREHGTQLYLFRENSLPLEKFLRSWFLLFLSEFAFLFS
jgi:hypothetical protein